MAVKFRTQTSETEDLVRLLDCSGTVVTAGVSESVYNRLHIGQ